jgi:hypothetical protein
MKGATTVVAGASPGHVAAQQISVDEASASGINDAMCRSSSDP